MFRPITKRKLSALEREWEEKLRAAGEHPPEIRPLTASGARDGLKVVSTESIHTEDADSQQWEEANNLRAFGIGDVTSFVNLPEAIYWRTFGQAVHDLPPSYPARQRVFLEALAETGCVDQARARLPRLAKTTALRWLARFAIARKVTA